MIPGSGFIIEWCRPGTDGAEVVDRWQRWSKPKALEAARGPMAPRGLEPWIRGPKGGRERVNR